MSDIDARLAFVAALDRLKTVARASTLADGSRAENAAEHSWHLALWALVFEDELLARGADPGRVLALTLLHDVAAIDGGTSCGEIHRAGSNASAAEAAAARLFGLLPGAQGAELDALYAEFAGGRTPEARAAGMLDIAQPLYQELFRDDLSRLDRDLLQAALITGPASALASDWPALHDHASGLLERRGARPSPNLARRLGFLVEADRLKSITRGTPLFDGTRRERTGEHSWHVATMALVLAPHAQQEVDAARAARMLVIHDLVEIDAGDAPIHGDHDTAALALAESRAADRLFGMLPDPLGAELRALWDEFEASRTPDAIWAKTIDRLQPVLANLASGGGSWRDYDVSLETLDQRVGARVRRGAPDLWTAVLPRIERWFASEGRV